MSRPQILVGSQLGSGERHPERSRFQAPQKISGASNVMLIARSLALLVKARGFGMTQCVKLHH
jgi:hypothetical protein